MAAVTSAAETRNAGNYMEASSSTGNAAMNRYSIARDGNEYIVQVDAVGILRCSSQQEAAKVISDAIELLQQNDAPAHPNDISSGSRETQELIRYPWGRRI